MPFNQNKTEHGIATFPLVYTEYGMVAQDDVPEMYLGRPGELPAGVYDTVLVRDGQICDWDHHRERFLKSCCDMGLRVPEYVPEATIVKWVRQISAGELQCRISSFREKQSLRSGVGFYTMVLIRQFTRGNAAQGITCAVAAARRRSDDFSYHHKLTGRIEEERALDVARAQGFGDVLFLNDRDEICEAAYSNVVLVKNGVLYVPGTEAACLPGVTVKVLVEKARMAGVDVVSGPVKEADLHHADEVWLTSSLRGVQWVKGAGIFEGTAQPWEGSVYSRLVTDSA